MTFDLAAWQLLSLIILLPGLGYLLGWRASRTRRFSVADNKAMATELESVHVTANQLEKALESVELLHRSKSQFYSSTSHDLRQPLHALEMFSSALQRQDLNDTSAGIVSDISEVVADITRETNVLLDIARVDVEVLKLDPVEIDLGTETRRILNQFRRMAKAKSLQLEVTSDKGQVVVLDRVLFDRVLRNLIDNAVKFTDTGTVRISADYDGGNTVIVSVIDSGIGICEEDQESIYREFYQGKTLHESYLSGVGLGLTSVLKMVHRMGGEINIESPVDMGTSVTVKIPNVAPGVSRHKNEVNEIAERPVNASQKIVLVFQSDYLAGKSTAMVIESAGYRVILTNSLSEAHAAQKTHHISAICLEFSSETEMARQFLETLRLLNPEIPVVVLAPDAGSINFYQGLSVSVLPKPVDAKLLLKNICPVETVH